jgi:hypothetical protein
MMEAEILSHGRLFYRKRTSLLWLALLVALPAQAMPERLVVALDGIAYRDMVALQAGVPHTNFLGWTSVRRAFTAEEGYFPVSRMISTFPSASDVAWTDIFGDRPLPGYQRTYFSKAANEEIALNGVTTTVEHEMQMHYQLQNGFFRALGYMYPVHTYRLEIFNALREFRQAPPGIRDFYIYLRATDDAQHLDRDIFALLCDLDRKLQKLRAEYRAETGHDLEILILSDHGHNHAGRGKRVEVEAFLENHGYRVAKTIESARDVILPTVGIENWVEIHNSPEVTVPLVEQLCHLEGAEIIAANLPGQTNRFLVMNTNGESAYLDWRPEADAFRYDAERGDPLGYLPVVAALRQQHKLSADNFATADDWMTATMRHHYPLAPERIVRGLVRNTLNPATIIISLDNRYVHDYWATELGSRLVTCRSTHGGLDAACSAGIVLSNFQPTHDTSTRRVAAQFKDFANVNNFRATMSGAEWFTKEQQSAVRIPRRPLDHEWRQLPDEGVFLRVWSPELLKLPAGVSINAVIQKADATGPLQIGRAYRQPEPEKISIHFPVPLLAQEGRHCERIYELPAIPNLRPGTEYKMSGWVSGAGKQEPLFTFIFRTDPGGQPLVY